VGRQGTRIAWCATFALLLALVPATAVADDASVLKAYEAKSHEAELTAEMKKFDKVNREIEDKGLSDRRLRRMIAISQRFRKILAVIRSEVQAETASTEDGARAKRNAVKAIESLRRSFRLGIRGCRAALNERYQKAWHLFTDAEHAAEAAGKYDKRARRAFRDAGLKPDSNSVLKRA
jgi:hypothetical protein